jgi:hypothetical protein
MPPSRRQQGGIERQLLQQFGRIADRLGEFALPARRLTLRPRVYRYHTLCFCHSITLAGGGLPHGDV